MRKITIATGTVVAALAVAVCVLAVTLAPTTQAEPDPRLMLGEQAFRIDMVDYEDEGNYPGSVIFELYEDLFGKHSYETNSIKYTCLFAGHVSQSWGDRLVGSTDLIDKVNGEMNVNLVLEDAKSQIFDNYEGDFASLYSAMGSSDKAAVKSVTADVSFSGMMHMDDSFVAGTTPHIEHNDGEDYYTYPILTSDDRLTMDIEAVLVMHFTFNDNTQKDVTMEVTQFNWTTVYTDSLAEGTGMEQFEITIRGLLRCGEIDAPFSISTSESNPFTPREGDHSTTGIIAEEFESMEQYAPEGTFKELTPAEFYALKVELGLVKVHTIRFVNWDDSLIEEVVAEEGKLPSAPSNPVREREGKTAYRFTGWDRPVDPAYQDATYKAQYEPIAVPDVWSGEEVIRTDLNDCTDSEAYMGQVIYVMNLLLFNVQEEDSFYSGYRTNSIDFDSIYAVHLKATDGPVTETIVVLVDWVSGEMSITVAPQIAYRSVLFGDLNGDLSGIYAAIGHSDAADVKSMTADITFTGVNYVVNTDKLDLDRGKVTNIDHGFQYKYLSMDSRTEGKFDIEAVATIHFVFKDDSEADVVLRTATMVLDQSRGMDMEISYYSDRYVVEGTLSCGDVSASFDKTLTDSNPGSDIRGEYMYTTGIPPTVMDEFRATIPAAATVREISLSDFKELEHTTGAVPLFHKVSFIDGDNVTTIEVKHGATISAKDVPAIAPKEETAQFIYEGEWEGFDIEAPITDDATFTLRYKEILKKYEIRFVSEGEVFSTMLLDYGSPIKLPASVPSKDGKAFSSWDGFVSGMTVAGPAVFDAVFIDGTSTVNDDGSVTTVVEENGTKTTTDYAVDGTSTVKEETSGTIVENGKEVDATTVRETVKDETGKAVESTTTTESATTTITKKDQIAADGEQTVKSDITIESKDSEVATAATIVNDGANSTATATTTIGGATGSNVSVADDAVTAALNQLTLVEGEAGTASVEKTVVVAAGTGATESAKATISADSLKSIADKNASFSLKADVGTIVIDSSAASSISGSATAGAGVTMSIAKVDNSTLTEAQRNVVGDKMVIGLDASVGEQRVHQLGGKAKITVPYTLRAGETSDNITVYYVDDNGDATPMEASYDAATGAITFTVDHFSYYVVAEAGSLGSSSSSDDRGIPYGVIGIVAIILGGLVIFAMPSKQE